MRIPYIYTYILPYWFYFFSCGWRLNSFWVCDGTCFHAWINHIWWGLGRPYYTPVSIRRRTVVVIYLQHHYAVLLIFTCFCPFLIYWVRKYIFALTPSLSSSLPTTQPSSFIKTPPECR